MKGRPIGGLDEATEASTYGETWVNFAGVGSDESGYLATGGRVLSCTAMGEDIKSTQVKAYALMESLDLEGGHFRSDIAHRAIR